MESSSELIESDATDESLVKSPSDTKIDAFDELRTGGQTSIRCYQRKEISMKSPEKRISVWWRAGHVSPIPVRVPLKEPSKYGRLVDELVEMRDQSLDARAAYVLRYWDEMTKERAEWARKSLRFEAMPKPIVVDECGRFGGSGRLLKNEELDESVAIEESRDLYISRSGRHCKRKSYTEDLSEDFFLGDDCLGKKRTKTDVFSEDDEDIKLTMDKPFVPDKNHNKVKPTRTEKMLEKAMSQTKTKEEQETEKFLNSLSTITDDDEDFEPAATRKRVVPPAASQLKKRNRQPKKAEKANETETAPGPSTKRPAVFKRLGDPLEAAVEKTECPVCCKPFPKLLIEKHAWTCGQTIDDAVPSSSQVNGNGLHVEPLKTCELCDKVIPLHEYEAHLKLCLEARVG